MRLYLVHDEDNELSGRALDAIRGWARERGHEVVVDNASSLGLKSCIGCFGCWTRTPGVCVIRDAEGPCLERMVHADVSIFLTQIPYGSFSPSIKRFFDRMIPVLLPWFRVYRGEMHHLQRYRRPTRILHVAYGSYTAEELETFVELSRAHSDNVLQAWPLEALAYTGDGATLVSSLEREVAR